MSFQINAFQNGAFQNDGGTFSLTQHNRPVVAEFIASVTQPNKPAVAGFVASVSFFDEDTVKTSG